MTTPSSKRFDQFFSGYADRLSRFDGPAIAELYAFPCLMVGASGSSAGLEPADAIAGVDQIRNVYGPTGFEKAVARVLDEQALTDRFALVRVHWDYLGPHGAAIYENKYLYLLRRDGSDWRVCLALGLDDEPPIGKLVERARVPMS